MTRLRLLIVVAVTLMAGFGPLIALAHDVPDRVEVSVYLKPESERMVVLVRLPANALIDYLLPALPNSNWVDLANAEKVANEAARVWIADRLVLTENGTALPRPRLTAMQLSRVNDPSFVNYENAIERIRGEPIPRDALVLQEQITVDAMLEVPIESSRSDFAFTPQFGRLGVLVFTTLKFLADDGAMRQFQFEGDPETFHLDPSWDEALRHYFGQGIHQVASEFPELLLLVAAALIFLGVRPLAHFAVTMVAAEIGCILLYVNWSAFATDAGLLHGLLVAALGAYLAIEAIVAAHGTKDPKRFGLAGVTGLVLGSALASWLVPTLQFAGGHSVLATGSFFCAAMATQCVVLIVVSIATKTLLRFSLAPKAVVIIAAALIVHVSWWRMLAQARALVLTMPEEVQKPLAVNMTIALIVTLCVGVVYSKIRPTNHEAVR